MGHAGATLATGEAPRAHHLIRTPADEQGTVPGRSAVKITAQESGTAATWTYGDGTVQVTAVWTEKKPGKGEDGPPTALYHRRSGRGVLAVYDGAGGAGARSAGHTPDNREISGAFLASRVAHVSLEDWFVTSTPQRRLTDPCDLGNAILAALRRTGVEPSSKISGTMVRHLPTTLASIEYELAGRYVDMVARWAGDSRAYILDVADGLQAVTRDDAEDSDALVLLTNDQPMTNIICADRPFRINEYSITGHIERPVLLVCATDGFFNYVLTPAHFEFLLLDTMREAANEEGWARRLAELVQGYSGDDASLVIASFYPSFDAMKYDFSQRCGFLGNKYVVPLRGIHAEDHEQFNTVRKSGWAEYRTNYEKWIREMKGDR
jgi:serine/threonine protein phosphatase PrpC